MSSSPSSTTSAGPVVTGSDAARPVGGASPPPRSGPRPATSSPLPESRMRRTRSEASGRPGASPALPPLSDTGAEDRLGLRPTRETRPLFGDASGEPSPVTRLRRSDSIRLASADPPERGERRGARATRRPDAGGGTDASSPPAGSSGLGGSGFTSSSPSSVRGAARRPGRRGGGAHGVRCGPSSAGSSSSLSSSFRKSSAVPIIVLADSGRAPLRWAWEDTLAMRSTRDGPVRSRLRSASRTASRKSSPDG